jgi:hypothetical protein
MFLAGLRDGLCREEEEEEGGGKWGRAETGPSSRT